ncbi:flavodoxin domain-containing protein [Natronosalvus vescus]|uniref:flavodoxin domain-containing protein n=1 Tax=Natronosalvus vescus TaxID=2953881 RepID=UPI002091CABA|nr:flavodoxin domain-containing protein [Natronosalvus vescus]
MARVLVCYGSSEGQTAVIANHIADRLEDAGHDPIVISTKRPPENITPSNYDGIVIGIAIHLGSHPGHAESFVRSHADVLTRRPSALFSTELAATKPVHEARLEADEHAEAFLDAAGWEPDLIHVVAGTLKYREYGLLKRFVRRHIGRDAELDALRDRGHVDWREIDAFVESFEELLP